MFHLPSKEFKDTEKSQRQKVATGDISALKRALVRWEETLREAHVEAKQGRVLEPKTMSLLTGVLRGGGFFFNLEKLSWNKDREADVLTIIDPALDLLGWSTAGWGVLVEGKSP